MVVMKTPPELLPHAFRPPSGLLNELLTVLLYPPVTNEPPAVTMSVYSLNPMAGVVNGFRWALLGTGNGPDLSLWVSVGISVLIFISGLFYFRSMEKTFADTI